ncbi:MAG TPA: hypothetical protein VFS43_29850 [Polyangiaceae bacterium]|nr:hypothetical protein [Polyangiaceae bacterium]
MRGPPRLVLSLAAGLACLAATSLARADEGDDDGEGPLPTPTLPWALLQLAPSPGLLAGPDGTHFSLRWQVTPLLYSFGIHRGLSPWRVGVVEPLIRQAGSLELFVSPEYAAIGDRFASRWLLRAGVRSYFPLLSEGESLSVSVGSGVTLQRGELGATYEGGVYTLFGVFGLQVAYTPRFDEGRFAFTLRLRYF